MTSERFSFRAAVYLIAEKNDQILLMRRFQTGWKDGFYTLPAGHLDGNELITASMSREALEETGLIINPEDLQVIHVVHQMSDHEYFDFYLRANFWIGDPSICEPEKCDHMDWFDRNKLPDNLLPNVRSALERISDGNLFSEFTNYDSHK